MLRKLALAASVCALLATPVFAQSQGLDLGIAKSIANTSYTGIADVYTGVIAHYGNRAASSARRGQKLLNVCDAATGLTCADWSSSASTGLIVPTTIGGSSCSVISCEVATAYDDSGANTCSGGTAPCNLTQTHGTRPTLTLSGVNGLPTITCTGGQNLGGATTSATQPYTISFVAERTGSTSSVQTAFAVDRSNILVGFNSSSGGAFGYAGTILGITGLTESAFHAFQFLGNGASSSLKPDGTSATTGNAGTGATSTTMEMCDDNFSEALAGSVAEAAVFSGNQSSSFSAAHTNQSAAYGTP